jgi:hypothetical protein
MSARFALALAILLLPIGAHGSASDPLDADPYDYHARQQLARRYRQAGGYASAYYHAAWLTWLAPRQYAASDTGTQLLRDRRARDEATWVGFEAVAIAVAAVNAEQLVYDTCLNGALPGQASRLRAEVTDLLSSAEKTERQASRADAVARSALARLYLTLDDCLVMESSKAALRERPRVLQKAASLASGVAGRLPKSPGAHRTLAIARARLAEIENRPEHWDMAIEECETAQALDPYDPALSPMIWTLHLRAGHWADAQRWENGGPTAPRRDEMSRKSHKPAGRK